MMKNMLKLEYVIRTNYVPCRAYLFTIIYPSVLGVGSQACLGSSRHWFTTDQCAKWDPRK